MNMKKTTYLSISLTEEEKTHLRGAISIIEELLDENPSLLQIHEPGHENEWWYSDDELRETAVGLNWFLEKCGNLLMTEEA